jgi:hypothetical protein
VIPVKLAIAVAFFVTGCSFVLTKGPPKPAKSAIADDKPPTKPSCTDEMTWPVIDVAIAGVSAIAILVEGVGTHKAAAATQALLGVAAGAGAYVGYTRVKNCRAARAAWDVAEMKGEHRKGGMDTP